MKKRGQFGVPAHATDDGLVRRHELLRMLTVHHKSFLPIAEPKLTRAMCYHGRKSVQRPSC